MKKKRLIIRSAVILLLVSLAVWRLWLRSIGSFMDYPSRDLMNILRRGQAI